jgi:RelA/SpoT family protein
MFTGIAQDRIHQTSLSQSDYHRLSQYIDSFRENWIQQLEDGENALSTLLQAKDYCILAGDERSLVLTGQRALAPNETAITSRLKETASIIAKMQRFGESLANILDVWGYRVVVHDEFHLEHVTEMLTGLWNIPTKDELLLRHGALQFEWLRDYRKKSHAGLSNATSLRYDYAIHMNRHAPFGICEIQIMTEDLYKRACLDSPQDEAHQQFASRRNQIFKE